MKRENFFLSISTQIFLVGLPQLRQLSLRTSFLADKVFRDLDGDEIFIANLTSTQRQGQLINNNETYTVDFNPKGEVSLLKTDYTDHCGAILCKSGTEIHRFL